MSGLDGLGWPNPEDEPKPKTMNDTPETDAEANNGSLCDQCVPAEFARKLERERDEWKAKYIQQNKDLGCELRDPNGTIWDHAKTLQRERDEARERADTMFAKYVDILEQTRNERDDLAAALNRACANPTTGNWYREAQDALAAWKEARSES